MTAFIIRPFGIRRGIDFDEVEKQLIAPALQSIGAEGGATVEIMEAGNIRIDMFQRLLVADLVIADISTNNPNVFYELGIRHALQEKRTFLLRAKTLNLQAYAQGGKEGEIPFDLKTDRYFEYDPSAPAGSLSKLTDALRATAGSDRQDSPVFLLLPNLVAPDRQRFIPVPLGFGEEVQRAEKDKNAGKLTLLGLEARGFPWESTGLRAVGRALFLIKQYEAARTAWESLRKLDEYDFEANISLGNVYQRTGDLTRSDQALERAAERATEPKNRAEIRAQLGRNKKNCWTRIWTDASAEQRGRMAIDSPLLMEAFEQYLLAYEQDLNSYYAGLNALFLAIVIIDLAERFNDVWLSHFANDADGTRQLDEVRDKSHQIAHALELRIEILENANAQVGAEDPWLLVSAGDLNLMTQPDARRAIYFYKKAAAAQSAFVLDSARKQLMLLADLGIMTGKIEQALQVLSPAARPEPRSRIDRLLLFTGHRIDSADRQTPRFPQSKEELARQAIRAAIEEERNVAHGTLLGISGGANGGDILFLEECQELGLPTEMLLPLPASQFVTASVDAEDKSWGRRFYAQLTRQREPKVLAESADLPKWLQNKRQYDIWQRNNLWLLSEALSHVPAHLTLIALWDGEPGDGPGGTEHMVALASERGARIVHINTKTIFGT